nr:IS3 family transposase [Bacillus subtilis]WGD69223.1 IS3 family transposase [Bacillus subtilis]WGD69593.1 IS3 family transposase [Bacillus subtilis]
MELISGEAGVYGYRKLCLRLRSEYALQINKKKVYRLCKELDILQPQREVKFHYPRKLARNRIITESNQLWEADIKYGYIEGEERFFFILSLIDVYDRSIIDYHIGLHCTGHDAGTNSCGVPCLSVSNLKEKQSQSFERIMVHNLFL